MEINCSYLFCLKLTLGLSLALLSWSLSSPCILSGFLLICSPSEMGECLIMLQWLPLIISIKATLDRRDKASQSHLPRDTCYLISSVCNSFLLSFSSLLRTAHLAVCFVQPQHFQISLHTVYLKIIVKIFFHGTKCLFLRGHKW